MYLLPRGRGLDRCDWRGVESEGDATRHHTHTLDESTVNPPHPHGHGPAGAKISLFFTYSGVPGAVMSRMPMTMKIHCERPTMAWT